MTQRIPSVSDDNVQAFRIGSQLAVKCVLGVSFGLVCGLMLMSGMAEAGGRGGSGGRSSFARRSGPPAQTHQQGIVPKHNNPIYKHKHKNGGNGDTDGGGGGDGGDTSGAGAAEASGASDAAEAGEPAVIVYGMEVTALYKGAASKAGLEIGDIILKVNGTPTPTFEALAQAISQSGSQATLVVIREGDGAEDTETIMVNPQNGAIGVSAERVRVE